MSASCLHFFILLFHWSLRRPNVPRLDWSFPPDYRVRRTQINFSFIAPIWYGTLTFTNKRARVCTQSASASLNLHLAHSACTFPIKDFESAGAIQMIWTLGSMTHARSTHRKYWWNAAHFSFLVCDSTALRDSHGAVGICLMMIVKLMVAPVMVSI
jgi:hypothetical protein